MPRAFDFEIDSGITGLNGPLRFAVALAVAPFVVGGVVWAGVLGLVPGGVPNLDFYVAAALAVNVLIGWPLAVVLAIAAASVVRRVRLVIDPEAGCWSLERQTVYGTSRQHGALADLDHVDVEPGSWGLVGLRLVGCHEHALATVIDEGDAALRPGRHVRVAFGGAEPRPFREGEALCDVAEAVRDGVHAALGQGAVGVRRRG